MSKNTVEKYCNFMYKNTVKRCLNMFFCVFFMYFMQKNVIKSCLKMLSKKFFLSKNIDVVYKNEKNVRETAKKMCMSKRMLRNQFIFLIFKINKIPLTQVKKKCYTIVMVNNVFAEVNSRDFIKFGDLDIIGLCYVENRVCP